MASRTARLGLLSVAVLAAGIVIAAPAAEAGQRWRRHHDGGAVAAGLIGGLALGAIAGSVIAGSRPAYGHSYGHSYGYVQPRQPRHYRAAPVYVTPGYGYGHGYAAPRHAGRRYVRQDYYTPVQCTWRRQKVWLDHWTYQVRRVKVCG